jgi:hypothetical protein
MMWLSSGLGLGMDFALKISSHQLTREQISQIQLAWYIRSGFVTPEYVFLVEYTFRHSTYRAIAYWLYCLIV